VAAKKSDLTQLRPGFYVDAARTLYFDMKEFLAANGLPDAPELRRVILDEVRHEFVGIPIQEIGD
jgi:hypothetical protein